MSYSNSSRYWTAAQILRICIHHGERKNFHEPSDLSLDTSLATIITTSLAWPLSLALNILMLVVFYRDKSLLRSHKSNILLAALAVNDLLRSLFGTPLLFMKQMSYQYKLEPNCYVIALLATVVANVVSELIVTALNCERFLSLKCPIWHRSNIRKNHFYAIICGSYTIGIGLAVVRNFRTEAKLPFFMIYFACCIITLVLSVLIWWEIAKRKKKILHTVDLESSVKTDHSNQDSTRVQREAKQQTQEQQEVQHPPQEQADGSQVQGARAKRGRRWDRFEKKAAQMATFLGLAFIFTRFIPLFSFSSSLVNHDWMYDLQPLVQLLLMLNSLVNPLIYGIMNREIRKKCLRLVKCE